MSFGSAVQSCLRQYVGFSGRARRSEFWWFILFIVLVQIGTTVLDLALGTYSEESDWGLFSGVAALLLFLPSIAVLFRRLHDIDMSGWWWLLTLVPCLGFILYIVWGCIDSTPGENRFGPSEKYPQGVSPYVVGPAGWGVQFADFPTYAFPAVRDFLLRTGRTAPRDVYALAIQVEAQENPVAPPRLTVGWNTEQQVAFAASAVTDPAEARWDASFWLQEPRLVLGDAAHDPQGAQLAEQWVHGVADPHTAFLNLAGDIAAWLYDEGTVVLAFGRPLPVLVQADTDEETVAGLTAAANRGGEASDFLAWLRSR